MLRLEAHTRMRRESAPVCAGDAAVEALTRIDLHARLSRGEVEPPPADGIAHCRRPPKRSVCASNDEVVIEAVANPQLLVRLLLAWPDHCGRLEVKRRPLYRRKRARGNQGRVDRGEGIGRHG